MRSLLRKIRNFLFWGWNLRDDVNWDYASIYRILHIKLTRLRQGCYNDGHHVWSEKSREYKALSECIELCKRIERGETHYFFGQELDRIYGEHPDFETMFGSKRKVASEQDRKFKKYAIEKDQYIYKTQKERLHNLMAKWSDYWWD